MLRLIKRLFIFALLCLALTLAGVAGLVHYPFQLSPNHTDLVIESGSSLRKVAQQVNEAGIAIPPRGIEWYARLFGYDTKIKAGGYELVQGDTLVTILDKLTRGDFTQREITFIEGWTFRDIRTALATHPDVKQTITTMSDQAIGQQLGIVEPYIEGWFFPDTYYFVRGSKDIDILKRAYHAQQTLLNQAWQERSPDIQLKTPYEALIMASIIEKETGFHGDRKRIAGVFNNRLKLGMPLQTDPTVIYGMMVGQRYNGNIRRSDLQDSSNIWNTYTIPRLPPSPIAAAGKASLYAAVQPEAHRYLYFVAKGDGSSAFADNLNQHNRNVNQYILRR